MRRSADLAFCLENAEHLREVVTKLVLSLRRAIKAVCEPRSMR
jgi:hypothetical protein